MSNHVQSYLKTAFKYAVFVLLATFYENIIKNPWFIAEVIHTQIPIMNTIIVIFVMTSSASFLSIVGEKEFMTSPKKKANDGNDNPDKPE